MGYFVSFWADVTEKGLKFAIVEVRAYYFWRADLEGINKDMIYAVENFKAILKVELQITSLNTVGKQDAKSGHFGTTFPFFIRLSLKFAGW